MKRTDILAGYAVNEHGIITSPGKFEGEMLYAPYFADTASYGEELSFMEDGSGEYVSLVEVESDDRDEFPELGIAKYVLVTETDQGFVRVTTIETEVEAEKLRVAAEAENEAEAEDADETETDK